MRQRKKQVDVLVIGSGGAGCRAAIEAAGQGSSVIVTSKGPVGRSGLTPMTMPGFAAVFGTRDTDDSTDRHYEDTLKAGYYLSNKRMLRTFVESAPAQVGFLENLGLRFDRTETGEIDQLPLPGHTRRRCCWLDDNLGRILLNQLRTEMSRLGVVVLEDCFVVDLLTDGDRVVGATCIQMASGDVINILAKAVVVATGGSEGLYPFRSASPRATADGVAMACRAGAQIMDMEFMQFTPYVFIWPKSARSICVPADTTLMAMGAKYLNAKGERFLERYDPERMEMTTRDIQARAMFMEIQAGRGSEHGGVYLDCTNLTDYDGKSPQQIVKSQGGCTSDYLLISGVDILTQVVELGPASHFGMGGIRSNEKAETSLKGLYAAGEAAGGLHGANRLAANSMPEIIVFGAIAGKEAAKFAKDAGRVDERQAVDQGNALAAEAYALLENASGSVLSRAVKKQCEQAMFDYFGIVRNGQGMAKGLRELNRVAALLKEDMLIEDKNPVMNYDWFEALETRNMALVGKILGVGALKRQESRGAHYREDIPQMHPDWQLNTVVSQREGDLQISFEDPDKRW